MVTPSKLANSNASSRSLNLTRVAIARFLYRCVATLVRSPICPAQDRPQQTMPLRLGQEVQEMLR